MPGQTASRPPADVVMLCTEDSPAMTIRPRFNVAGGEVSRVHLLDSDASIMLTPDNIAAIEESMTEVGAQLLVIDPLMNYLRSAVDAYSDQDVRQVLRPIAAAARRCNASVLVVRHLTKANGGPALRRGAGSMGIIGAARSSLSVTTTNGQKVLRTEKRNLSGPVAPIRYRIADCDGIGRVESHVRFVGSSGRSSARRNRVGDARPTWGHHVDVHITAVAGDLRGVGEATDRAQGGRVDLTASRSADRDDGAGTQAVAQNRRQTGTERRPGTGWALGPSEETECERSARFHSFCCSDPDGNRTHVFAVRGRRTNRYTTGPSFQSKAGLLPHFFVRGLGFEPR